jgi:hypothetical protein
MDQLPLDRHGILDAIQGELLNRDVWVEFGAFDVAPPIVARIIGRIECCSFGSTHGPRSRRAPTMPISAGQVFVDLGARLDRREFDAYDKQLKEVQSRTSSARSRGGRAPSGKHR